MPVSSTNNVTVFTAPDNFASLEAVSPTQFDYKFTLSVSKIAAGASSAATLVTRTYVLNPQGGVNMSLFNRQPNISRTLSVLNLDSSRLVNSILSRTSDSIASSTSLRSAFLTKDTDSVQHLIETNNTGVGYLVHDASLFRAGTHGIPVPVAQSTVLAEQLRADKTIANLSMELLTAEKTDPAQAVVGPSYSTLTAYESTNGVPGGERPSDGSTAEKLRGVLLSDNATNSSRPLPVVEWYSVSRSDTITVPVFISVPASLILQNDFWVLFTVLDDKGSMIQEFAKLVHHRNAVATFTKPTVPPSIEALREASGAVRLSVQQLDPHATGFNLYRVVYNGSNAAAAVQQEFVGSYGLDPGETKVIRLMPDKVGMTLFRAVASTSDLTCSDFSSAVIDVMPGMPATSFCNVQTRYEGSGLSVLISEIPNYVAFVKLYKADITNGPVESEDVLLETLFVGGSAAGSSFSYLDTGVVNESRYRYSCSFLDVNGQELPTSGLTEVYYRRPTVSYTTVAVDQPTITNTAGAFDVSFRVSYTVSDRLEDTVSRLLSNQGLAQYYGADINRDRLKDLLVTKVELKDLTTNDLAFLGYTDGQFTQSTTGYGLLTKPGKYRYVLTTFVRPPVSLLEGVKKTANSTPRPSATGAPKTYTYSPFNLNNPFGLQTGTNPKTSGNEFISLYGMSQFEFGAITDITEVAVNLTPPVPVVANLRAHLANSKSVELTWSLSGAQDEVSHFIIRRENAQTGKVDIVGKAHGVNSRNSYSYLAPLRHTEMGVFRYTVVPGYTDLTLGQTVTSNEVVV